MKTRVFNLVIIDESGSMHSIKKEAIDSVNETIQSVRSAQKNDEEQEYFVSLVTFNNNVKTVCDCVRADEVSELTEKTYNPSCCTALYDAMGVSIMNCARKSQRVIGCWSQLLPTDMKTPHENIPARQLRLLSMS